MGPFLPEELLVVGGFIGMLIGGLAMAAWCRIRHGTPHTSKE